MSAKTNAPNSLAQSPVSCPGVTSLPASAPARVGACAILTVIFFSARAVTAHDKNSYCYSQTSHHCIASYRPAGADLLNTRSTDHAPDPAIMIAAAIASTST